MADTEVHWSSEAARQAYAREQEEARRPPTLAEAIYGKKPVDGKAQRLAGIRAGIVAKPLGRRR